MSYLYLKLLVEKILTVIFPNKNINIGIMTIYLRPIYISDIEYIFKMKKNSNNWIYTPKNNFDSRTLRDEIKWWNSLSCETNTIRFAICLNQNNQIIGSTTLSNIDFNNKTAHFHIYIDELYKGNGYGKESIKLILKYAKDIVKLKSINLNVHKDNIIAENLYKKFNFTLTEKCSDDFLNYKLIL